MPSSKRFHRKNRREAYLAVFAIASLSGLEGKAQSPRADDTVRVPFIRIIQTGPPPFTVRASYRTPGQVRLSLTADRGKMPIETAGIRIFHGTKEELINRARNVRVENAKWDTCFFIVATRRYPVDIADRELSISGGIDASWLDVDQESKILIPTNWVLVIEEGPDSPADAIGLRMRRNDFVAYLTRAVDVLFVPARPPDAPRARAPGVIPSEAYIRGLRCMRYLGPRTAETTPADLPAFEANVVADPGGTSPDHRRRADSITPRIGRSERVSAQLQEAACG